MSTQGTSIKSSFTHEEANMAKDPHLWSLIVSQIESRITNMAENKKELDKLSKLLKINTIGEDYDFSQKQI